jgi:hypothetical protein
MALAAEGLGRELIRVSLGGSCVTKLPCSLRQGLCDTIGALSERLMDSVGFGNEIASPRNLPPPGSTYN